MPLYDYLCNSCGRQDFDIFARPDDSRKCPCGSLMDRQLPTVNINPDYEPYLDEHLGHEPVYVKSRRHLKDELKRRNLVQIG